MPRVELAAWLNFVNGLPGGGADRPPAATDSRLHKVPLVMPTLDGYLYRHETLPDVPNNRRLRDALVEAVKRG